MRRRMTWLQPTLILERDDTFEDEDHQANFGFDRSKLTNHFLYSIFTCITFDPIPTGVHFPNEAT